jgi:hypothetical protein
MPPIQLLVFSRNSECAPGKKDSPPTAVNSSLEKKFDVTRMHAGRHQTLTAIIKTMEVGTAMRFTYAYIQVTNRCLADGEIVDACRDLLDMEISPFILGQAMLCVVGFLAHLTVVVDHYGPPPEDQVSFR